MHDGDGGVEAALACLRREGVGKIGCILLLRRWTGCTVPQAMAIVDASEAWCDRREADQALHDEVFEALRQWAEEEGGSFRESADGSVEVDVDVRPRSDRDEPNDGPGTPDG